MENAEPQVELLAQARALYDVLRDHCLNASHEESSAIRSYALQSARGKRRPFADADDDSDDDGMQLTSADDRSDESEPDPLDELHRSVMSACLGVVQAPLLEALALVNAGTEESRTALDSAFDILSAKERSRAEAAAAAAAVSSRKSGKKAKKNGSKTSRRARSGESTRLSNENPEDGDMFDSVVKSPRSSHSNGTVRHANSSKSAKSSPYRSRGGATGTLASPRASQPADFNVDGCNVGEASFVELKIASLTRELGVEELGTDLLSAISPLADSILNAVHNPKTIFPRTMCGGIPVDPALLFRLSKQYRILDALDEAAAAQMTSESETDNAAQKQTAAAMTSRSMKQPPKSSAELLRGVSTRYQSLCEALKASVSHLQEIRTGFNSVLTTLRELEDIATPLRSVRGKQGNISIMAERMVEILNSDTKDTPHVSLTSDAPISMDTLALGRAQVTPKQFGMGMQPTVTRIRSRSAQVQLPDLLEEVMQIAQDIAAYVEPLRLTLDKLRDLGDSLGQIASQTEKALRNAMGCIGEVVTSVRGLHGSLPSMAREIRQFFVPTGIRATFLRPSPDAVQLLESLDELIEALPDANSLESSSRSILDECETPQKLISIQKALGKTTEVPQKLLPLLSKLKDDVPQTMMQVAAAELQRWMEEEAKDAIEARVEDAVEDLADAAEDLIGENATNVLASLFGTASDEDKAGDDVADVPGNVIATAGGALSSLFQ